METSKESVIKVSYRVATIRVEDVRRQLRVDEEIWNRTIPEAVMILAGQMVPAIVEMHTPKRTGELIRSAKIRVSPTRLHIWFDAPYATYVDEGFPASPGRYVPEPLEKRLVSREMTPRQRVLQAARKRGLTGRIPKNLTIRMINVREIGTEEGPVVGFFTPREKRDERTGKMKARPLIMVATGGRSKEEVDDALSHELWHSMQYASQRERSESEAAEVELEREKDIGEHPGYRGANFSEAIANDLKEDLRGIIEVIVRREWGV